MATVWIFFGSGATTGDPGIAAAAVGNGAADILAGGGATDVGIIGEVMPGVIDGMLPGACESGDGKTGMVETTRGAVFIGTGTSTGFSSRDTSFSLDPPPPVCAALCALPAFGIILFGPVSALMIGGSDGSIEPPNTVR